MIRLSDSVHWIGVNDRETDRFENYWPLERGVAYNSYIVVDEKVAILDTVKFTKTEEYIDKIRNIIGDRPVDYLIVNHMEPDHSGSIQGLLREYPNMQIVGNKKTFPMITGFYGITENFYEIAEGDVLDLGNHKLQFFMVPMLHWPETMVTYDQTDKILFSMDAFGGFGALDGGIFDDEVNLDHYYEDIRRYYSNIVAKYSPQVQRALTKLAPLDIKIIAPTHGPVWRTHPERIIELYDRWSKYEAQDGVVIIYGSMYGNTARMAEHLARQCSEAGMKEVHVFDASKTHVSHLLNALWKYKGAIIGSCSYNTKAFPAIENLLGKIEMSGLKNRYLGVFGSKSWSGGGVRAIEAFRENVKWEEIVEPIESLHSPSEAVLDDLTTMAKEMVRRLNEDEGCSRE